MGDYMQLNKDTLNRIQILLIKRDELLEELEKLKNATVRYHSSHIGHLSVKPDIDTVKELYRVAIDSVTAQLSDYNVVV